MILRLSEDEVKEAVVAWIEAKTTYSVEKEQVKLEITAGGSLGSPRFNYVEIDLDKKPTPFSITQGSVHTGYLKCRDSSAPPKPEPPKPEKYTKGD